MSTPIGPYTPIVSAGPWLITSGQLGLAADGVGPPTLVEGGAPEQLTQALANVERLLAEHGAGITDIVKTTVFATDLAELRRRQRGLRRGSSATTARPGRWWAWPPCRWGPPSRSRCGPTARPDDGADGPATGVQLVWPKR